MPTLPKPTPRHRTTPPNGRHQRREDVSMCVCENERAKITSLLTVNLPFGTASWGGVPSVSRIATSTRNIDQAVNQHVEMFPQSQQSEFASLKIHSLHKPAQEDA
eukprot:2336286-Amphidinium_carterae.1